MRPEKTTGNRDIRKILGVKGAQELADVLAKKMPTIAAQYRGGETQRRIAEAVHSELHLPFSISFIRSAVQMALSLLISREEREKLAREHLRTAGLKALEKKSGVHAFTKEKRQEAARQGMAERKGLFSLTTAEIRRRCAAVTGTITWKGVYVDEKTSLDLGDYCFSLVKEGELSHARIADRLNEVFGDQLPKLITAQSVTYYLFCRRHGGRH